MDAKIKVIAVPLIVALLASVAYAVISVSFHQNLTVPTTQGIEVYRNDGVTLIGEGSDQASIWTWDSVNTRFTANIKAKNIGNTNIDVTVVFSNLAIGWTGSTSGTLTSITPSEMRSITLYATNPSAVGGSSTSDFTVTVSKV